MKTAAPIGLALCLCGVVPSLAYAQGTYPSRPIRLIVPQTAGGMVDTAARTVAQPLAQRLGQPVIVDNRAGANAVIGTEAAVKSTPDGHTLLLVLQAALVFNVITLKNLPYDSLRDFASISLLFETPYYLAVHDSVPARSVKELIELARSRPGKLTYASAGAGGTIHLSAELFKSMTGITMEHIAYKSSPLAHLDMIGGQVHAMFDAMPTALPQVRAGKLRALAVTTAQRSSQLPELPTVAEAGVPGFEAAGWFGFAAPAGTPKDVVNKLNKEIVRILNLPDVKERLIAQGAEPVGDTPEKFAKYIKAEAAKWGKVIRTLNLKIE